MSAVWFAGAMGLLEDAIREHLELKRRRGADPGEVARAEHEALEPDLPEQAPTSDGDLGPELDLAELDDLAVGDGDAMDPRGALAGPPEAELTSLGQETAELDMVTVLGDVHEEPAAPPTLDPFPPASAADPHGGGTQAEDSLEWEMPARARAQAPVSDAQEALGDGAPGDGAPGERALRRRILDGPPTPEQTPAERDDETHAEVPGQERLTFEQ